MDSFKFARRFALVLLSVTLTTGCGFQLRGTSAIELENRELALEMRRGELPDALQIAFDSTAELNNIALNSASEYRILVTDARLERRSTTLRSTGQVDEYTLTGQVNFNIYQRDVEQPIAEGLEAFAERTYQYDANAAAASNSQEQLLRREIWRRLSEQMLRQFAGRIKAR